VKNCDQGLENVALGLWPRAANSRPRAAFSCPRSQFFTIRTNPKPANNMFIYFFLPKIGFTDYKWVSLRNSCH